MVNFLNGMMLALVIVVYVETVSKRLRERKKQKGISCGPTGSGIIFENCHFESDAE